MGKLNKKFTSVPL